MLVWLLFCAQDVDSLQKAAMASYAKGDYAGARSSLEQAWELAKEIPDSDPKRYELLKLLSRATSAGGDYQAALDWVELAVNWREVNVARDDPKLADEWIEMAVLSERLKDFSRSLELLRQAMRSHVRQFGAESVQVADDFSRIAILYLDQKQPEEAAPVLEHGIDIREKAMGAENPSILSDLDRLAAVRITLREYDKAETAFRRALVIRERLLGPMHAGLIESVEGLAYAEFGEKKYDDAEAGYKRLLGLWLFVTNDPAHPMVALTLDKLANFYRETKRWDEGTAASEKAIVARQRFRANGYLIEATARQGHGEKAEAERFLRAALGALDESRPEHAQARASIQKLLDELQAEAGKEATKK